jgi:hypothetical protein
LDDFEVYGRFQEQSKIPRGQSQRLSSQARKERSPDLG